MSQITIKFIWEEGADRTVPLPSYETAGAAGADLRANLPKGDVVIAPGARALIATGLRVSIPAGFELQLRPRSGLALKHGIMLPNSPGTIDADYRGPLGVIVMNCGAEDFCVTHSMRIAQLVVAPVIQAQFVAADTLDETTRGTGGFGSTGVS
ncbi:MAG: dUTP diphosphatase [Sulfitobacter sp.]